MIKAYLKILDYKLLIILLLAFIASPLLCGQNTYTICLIYSHYLTVYLNNIFLLFVYQEAYHISQLTYPLIIRIGFHRFYLLAYFFIISLGLIYNFIIYIGYYCFFGRILSSELWITICFMITNLMICCFECSVVYLQLGKKKNFMYLAIPILINFIFHFTWIKYI